MSNRFFFADVGTTSTLTDTLKNTITSSQTDIELNDASNFPTKGEIMIETELIKYTGRTNNILNGCLRNNNPVSHNSDVNVVLQARNGDSALATDNFYTGWYKERGSSDITLRVNDSNLMMKGTIRFNKTSNIFQGYNGTEWVSFNAEKGDTGNTGESASDQFNFINLPELEVKEGEIFKDKTTTDINLRSLKSGTFDLNSGITGLEALNITKSNDYLTLRPNPQPYVWDFSTNQTSNITYFKSALTDTKLKAFGTISKWKVKTGKIINAGTAVRISLSSNGSGYVPSTTYLVIEPYEYTETTFNQEIKEGSAFLGIALETKNGGETCEVCTEGITTVKIGDVFNPFNYGFSLNNIINGPGAFGFIGNNAEIYNVGEVDGFITNTPIAGYWLERGTFSYGNGVLFYVKGNFVFN
jgi:hypothetical protein